MSATIEDWVALLPTELLDLADADESSVGWLALAEEYLNAGDRAPQVSARAYRHLGGTFGQQYGAWHDLVDAVEMFHRWDQVADGQGRHSELSIPSREKVCDDVAYALRALLKRAVA